MNDAPSRGGFIQFPLALLAVQAPFEDILDGAFSYAVVEFIDKTREPGAPRFRDLPASDRDEQVEKARNVMRFTGGNAGWFLKHHKSSSDQAERWVSRMGPTCSVRLRNDLFFGARKEKEPTERELRILLGIYSVIGAKPYAKVGWPMIQARAAGAMRPPADGIPEEYRGPLYSRGQIDRTCAELIARGLVVQFTFNKGERFWSNKLSRSELAEKIEHRKLRRVRHAAAQRQDDAAVSARILAARANLQGNAHAAAY